MKIYTVDRKKYFWKYVEDKDVHREKEAESLGTKKGT
jgi:hypothetical protein